MILLTGATGTIGSALLRRLTVAGMPVRCLVRDPRKLGSERVRVQLALGDLGTPGSFRNAMRGVKTVVHLAASIRDQPHASIEEINAVGTLRLLRAAERAGVERFVFASALGVSLHSRTAFFRSKALAEEAVADSEVPSTIFAPSIVFAPDDPWMTLLRRFSYLPAMPVSGSGKSVYQPIWAEDAADCLLASLQGSASNGSKARFELAGPDMLTHDAIVRIALRSFGRRRRLLHLPLPFVRRSLDLAELVAGPQVFATWDEAELMELSMTSERGVADARALGVSPLSMAEVLAAG